MSKDFFYLHVNYHIKCKHVVINDPCISVCDSFVIIAVIFLKKTPWILYTRNIFHRHSKLFDTTSTNSYWVIHSFNTLIYYIITDWLNHFLATIYFNKMCSESRSITTAVFCSTCFDGMARSWTVSTVVAFLHPFQTSSFQKLYSVFFQEKLL